MNDGKISDIGFKPDAISSSEAEKLHQAWLEGSSFEDTIKSMGFTMYAPLDGSGRSWRVSRVRAWTRKWYYKFKLWLKSRN